MIWDRFDLPDPDEYKKDTFSSAETNFEAPNLRSGLTPDVVEIRPCDISGILGGKQLYFLRTPTGTG